MDITSRPQATEHFMVEVKADKAAKTTWREESLFCNQPAHTTSRAHTRRWHTSGEPHQATSTAMADISEAVRATVAAG